MARWTSIRDWIGALIPSQSPETGYTVTPSAVVKVGMSDFCRPM